MNKRTEASEVVSGQNPKKKILIYNFNFGVNSSNWSGKVDEKKIIEVNQNIDSLINEFQTAVMDIDTYNTLKEISNPPFPGKRNFIITTNEVLLNNSVEGLEFAGIEEINSYLVNDSTGETVLFAVKNEQLPGLLSRKAARELAIAFDPLISGSEVHLGHENVLNLEYNGYFRYDTGLIKLNYKVVK